MTNTDVTDVQVEAQSDAVELDAPVTDGGVKVDVEPQVPTAPAPRTGNSAQADEEIRTQVAAMMEELKKAGYVRPELQVLTGFNDSTVWRAQNRKVHTAELDTWMALFERFTTGELLQTNPPKAAQRKPKVEDLLARIAELEADFTAKIDAAVEVLAGEARTPAQYKRLVDQATNTLRGTLQDA